MSQIMIAIFLVFFFLPTNSNSYIMVELSENKTIKSPGEIFELGVFRGGNIRVETVWYVGIWFKRFPGDVVWVANRDNPLSDSTGILGSNNSDLFLLNKTGSLVWKTSLTSTGAGPLVEELRDDGNFVVRYTNRSNSDGVLLWQSFDYPTDTLLPGMLLSYKLVMNSDARILRSWIYSKNPSSGHYTYQIDEYGQSSIWDGGNSDMYRIDPQDTTKYTTYTTTTNNGDEVTQANYTLRTKTTTNYYSTLRLSYDGFLSLNEWTQETKQWKNLWTLPSDRCDNFHTCGRNAYCIMNPMQSCSCLQGFQPTSSQERDEYDIPQGGCVRKSQLTCVENGFQLLKKMKLPEIDDGTIVYPNIESKECEQRCLQMCDCAAYANTDMPIGGWSCVLWTGDLLDIRRYNTDQGQTLYVKLAAQDMERNSNKKKWIKGFALGGSGLLLLSVVMLCFWKRNKITALIGSLSESKTQVNNNPPREMEETTSDWKSESMDFDIIAEATNNFSDANKIGSGGFGDVYKGRLLDGQEIAVKRLYNLSDEGIRGYFNEVNLIRKLQHINLVRLLGFFYNQQEKILVYEFLENSSLDTHLFDTTRRSMLSWDKRLDITKGIARGLVYLHQDSRFRIIHLDLKAGNVLLSKEMVPKLSDFGMAKTLEGDDTEGLVRTAAGTYGYMAPEYAAFKIYSAKSDVYSFGVLLLEILTGQKTREFSRLNQGELFLEFVWRSWSEGKGLEIVDPVIKDSAPEQALRCIQIGLLCVQGNAWDRPMMSSVVLMLGSHTELMDCPKSPFETGASSSRQHRPQGESSTMSRNQITLSSIGTR